jgi:hypothetical protein
MIPVIYGDNAPDGEAVVSTTSLTSSLSVQKMGIRWKGEDVVSATLRCRSFKSCGVYKRLFPGQQLYCYATTNFNDNNLFLNTLKL